MGASMNNLNRMLVASPLEFAAIFGEITSDTPGLLRDTAAGSASANAPRDTSKTLGHELDQCLPSSKARPR